jgi:hypothetical protein
MKTYFMHRTDILKNRRSGMPTKGDDISPRWR